MASDFQCSDAFTINFSAVLNAQINLTNVSTRPDTEITGRYYYTVFFTYVRGLPLATGFRLNSADSLSGAFFPPSPIGDALEVQSGQLEGSVQIPDDADISPEGITYNGTITILQA